MHRKLLKLWIYFTFMTMQLTHAQNVKLKINKADSLFAIHQYPVSQKLYSEVFDQTGQYTLSMLLKMAMLAENDGDYSLTLFYLNIYYKERPEKSVLLRMEQLADQYHLQGYNYTDLEYFRSLYNEYFYLFLVYTLTVACIYFLYLLYKKSKNKKLGLRPAIFIATLIFLYLITNYRITRPRAIIAYNNTCLMNSPSAASELLSLANEGHRVTLIGKNDIWYKIKWEGTQAFIRQDQLHIIPQKQKSLF